MSHRSKFLIIPVLFVAAVALARTLPGGERGKDPVAAGGSDSRVSGSWEAFEKPSAQALRDRLTPLQYRVTQEDGTEPAFRNEYWDNHEAGLYVDAVSGEPLFSSRDKFDSGTGWPSFTRPVSDAAVVEREDRSFGRTAVEVRSRRADSHLGHVFEDGPEPTGLRYCINSAALRFIPEDQLEAEGYGDYVSLFRPMENKSMTSTTGTETAILAGGCFWGMEDILRDIPGVLDTEVGYTGGSLKNPGYSDLKNGDSGHAEGVQIVFDPAVIGYEEILGYFFRMHDPTTRNRQGNDVGSQYRSAIFCLDDGQKEIAERVKREVASSGKWKNPIVTEIVPAGPFYPAEDYHQDYLEKHPNGYTCHYLRD